MSIRRSNAYPSETTRPRDYQEAINQKFCQIWVLHANDQNAQMINKLLREQRWAPYAVPVPQIEPKPMRACVVFITHFTNDNINIAYYIEETHVTRFLVGTFGMQAYNGSALITPITFTSRDSLFSSAGKVSQSSPAQMRVTKNDAQLEKVRWRYLYETARIQWAKLEFVHTRWKLLKDQIQEAPEPKISYIDIDADENEDKAKGNDDSDDD
ncbi:hypothetical protein T440DRAFT_514476 [Plenodomus tracheiphilus IPT5]|uniref:Uncharacterized protein n=1 Tax=Plenodomus tracheiphilus IPT5 TaxID=1408161 RepID=A0A6A7BII6_9PLEO|nr:hypothetical protein T440DRAFT_514476 [Plenodomus tracheiphilus IPT5]